MNILISAGLYIGPLVILVLLIKSRKKNVNTIFLAFSLFCAWYGLLLNELHVTKEILHYPYLIRTGNFFGYLIYPFLYVYIRNTFYPGKSWQKKDFLLLIPAFFYLVDMFPFIFFTSSEEKIAVTRANLDNLNQMFRIGEGWIGIKGFHFIGRYVFSSVLLALCYIMIYQNRHNTEPHLRKKFNAPLLFSITLVILYTPLLFPGTFGTILHSRWFDLHFLSGSLSVTLISVLTFLIFSPDVLYGYLDQTPVRADGQGGNPEIKNPPAFCASAIIQQVETFVKEKKPFLQPGYSIHDLSTDTMIPVYQLSYAIHSAYDIHFNNWINRLRIEYFLVLAWEKQNLTLEALAKESGFSNRITFSNAFKKEKQLSPGQYLRKHPQKVLS